MIPTKQKGDGRRAGAQREVTMEAAALHGPGGLRFDQPMALGHAFAGEAIEIGPVQALCKASNNLPSAFAQSGREPALLDAR